jgi:hypothetical protein
MELHTDDAGVEAWIPIPINHGRHSFETPDTEFLTPTTSRSQSTSIQLYPCHRRLTMSRTVLATEKGHLP